VATISVSALFPKAAIRTATLRAAPPLATNDFIFTGTGMAKVRDLPARAREKLYEFGIASLEAVEAAPEDASRLNDIARLRLLEFRYYLRLAKIKLPACDHFSDAAQYEEATKLASTFRELRLLEQKLRLPETERGEVVKRANSLAMLYYREHGPSRRSLK
jgi:hypothetical protein